MEEKKFWNKRRRNAFIATFIYCYIRFVVLLFLEHFFFVNKIIRNVFGTLLFRVVIVEKLTVIRFTFNFMWMFNVSYEIKFNHKLLYNAKNKRISHKFIIVKFYHAVNKFAVHINRIQDKPNMALKILVSKVPSTQLWQVDNIFPLLYKYSSRHELNQGFHSYEKITIFDRWHLRLLHTTDNTFFYETNTQRVKIERRYP